MNSPRREPGAVYSVVGCGECEALWVVPGDPETTGCPRCGKRHRFARLKRFAATEDEDLARRARSTLLAERSGHGEAFAELGSFQALADHQDVDRGSGESASEAPEPDPDGFDDGGGSPSKGSAGASTSRHGVVREALRELEGPDEAAVVEYAGERDVPPEACRELLARLVETGEVSQSGGRYRLL